MREQWYERLERGLVADVTRRRALAVLLGAATLPLHERVGAAAAQRPIADFLTTQGTTTIFVPPYPDFIRWGDNPLTRFASVDFAGLETQSLGTQTTGTVLDRPLKDGMAEVRVELHTTNALCWVSEHFQGDDNFVDDPLLFGYRANDLPSAAFPPALGDAHFSVVFTNTAPGAPLPDLVDAFILGNALPGQALVSIAIQASATGPLHETFGVAEGTPGRLTVTQRGLFHPDPHGALGDGFPAERVDLSVVGGDVTKQKSRNKDHRREGKHRH